MKISTKYLPCDGCGLPASPEHIAERVRRLEHSTQFRPIHISALFVALAPPSQAVDDFYAPPNSKTFFDPFMDALEIPLLTEKVATNGDIHAADLARLAEFQRRGYYLTYLSECALPENAETADETVARLGPTLVRRIKFNYRPKQIAPLGQELFSLVKLLKGQEIETVLTAGDGLVLPVPATGSQDCTQLFRRLVTA